MIAAFEYPTRPHARKHGPFGYSNYESYRDWLRDEFSYRCIYCLHRENWSGSFHLDHLTPITIDPSRECDYANLLYACDRCNLAKSSIELPVDPCDTPFGDYLRMETTGEIRAINEIGVELTKILRPNTTARKEFRRKWIVNLELLQASNPGLLRQWLSYPLDLPDLRTKKIGNTRPDGVHTCCFARRERGELPDIY